MISVLLPAYNSSETIEISIRSILNQTFSEFECLVLDDGSTDGLEKIVSGIRDPRVRYIRYPHRGVAATMNAGLQEARYDIIARMDADDVCVPWRFEKQLHVLRQLPRNTILSCWYGMFNGASLQYLIKTPLDSSEIRKGLLLHSYICNPGLLCYKDVYADNGGTINEVEVDAFQDYETWLKKKDDVTFHIIPEFLVYQRYGRQSISNNIAYKHRIMFAIQRPYYDDLSRHFQITDAVVENRYRGWREFFYGDRTEARKYWKKMGAKAWRSPRVIMAWCATFLPDGLFIRFTEWRLRYRLEYLLNYFSVETRSVRRIFDQLIQRDR
jgi:glycosyltransferase involved in cell wall biosynthesis